MGGLTACDNDMNTYVIFGTVPIVYSHISGRGAGEYLNGERTCRASPSTYTARWHRHLHVLWTHQLTALLFSYRPTDTYISGTRAAGKLAPVGCAKLYIWDTTSKSYNLLRAASSSPYANGHVVVHRPFAIIDRSTTHSVGSVCVLRRREV